MSTKRVCVISDHMKVYGKLLLERGQVFELQNMLNDEKLIGWNYIREMEPKEEVYRCACGRDFVGQATDPATQAHLRKWRHDCQPLEVTGIQLKSKGPKLAGGGDPDKGDVGWDVGVGAHEGPDPDPFAGERTTTGKEKPRRVTLGG